MSSFVIPTFWTRPGTRVHEAARADEMNLYFDRLTSDNVHITYISVPVWTLVHDFALEEITLLRRDGGPRRVRFSGGPEHGSWDLVRWDPARRQSSFLNIQYLRGDDITNLRDRTFESIWGSTSFVKRPDAEGDLVEWSQFLIPVITNATLPTAMDIPAPRTPWRRNDGPSSHTSASSFGTPLFAAATPPASPLVHHSPSSLPWSAGSSRPSGWCWTSGTCRMCGIDRSGGRIGSLTVACPACAPPPPPQP